MMIEGDTEADGFLHDGRMDPPKIVLRILEIVTQPGKRVKDWKSGPGGIKG
jgi:hypothetical protein